jgi:hypothetical protein
MLRDKTPSFHLVYYYTFMPFEATEMWIPFLTSLHHTQFVVQCDIRFLLHFITNKSLHLRFLMCFIMCMSQKKCDGDPGNE